MYIHAHTHTCIYVYIFAYMYIYICVCLCVYTCMHMYIYWHMFLVFIYRHALPPATVLVGIGREKRSATTKTETNATTSSPRKKKKRHGPKRMIGECVCERERAREREVGGLVWLDENRSWHTYEWAMSRVWMRHVKRVNTGMSHVTRMNESCHTHVLRISATKQDVMYLESLCLFLSW